ncbi:MAG TPA: saccharopine dehydrogenase NADP-binding domain-containing protein [Xanthomonadales bacterium]|nr:saccharopine dehydrogenase NADP-binding domain-containing protein [Xanthomonadales bacterium]
MSRWMIYGANGYTGRLVAAAAVARGQAPVLAGRNRGEVEAMARDLGLPGIIVSLDERTRLRDALRDLQLVLHCAGPFSATSQPMIEACLDTGTHYLDITGEIGVFENAWSQSDQARRADVVLCPGAGFDVVPTDCLAASLVAALPAATRLQLAFEAGGGLSPGTAKTSIEGLGRGGMVRRKGILTPVPLAWKTRTVPFRHATRTAVTIPWGDVFTAWVSTGVADIEVYLSAPAALIRRLRLLRHVRPLLGFGPVQRFLKHRVERSVRGPSAEVRASSQTQLWGEVSSADGRSVSATMVTPNGYEMTVSASLGLVEYLLEHDPEGGYYTPSLLAGAGFAETLPGVSLELGEPRAADSGP